MIIEHTGSPPELATPGSAGYDLRANMSARLYPGSVAIVKTDLRLAIPTGYCGMVCSRSGLAAKHGVFVLNAPGIIDSDYRKEVGVIMMNLGADPVNITTGDRIAQLLIVPVCNTVQWLQGELSGETERSGGFGSTGVV